MSDTVEESDFNPFAGDGAIDYSQVYLERHLESPHRSPIVKAFTSSSNSGQMVKPGNHIRARTEAGTSSTSGQYHHPLRGVDSAHGDGDAGVTRPHLNRALYTGMLVDVPSAIDEDDLSREEATRDERTVLVHEVSSKDSLAGVALKYGISLAELRRANHMWFSDSIHSRKVLYIPLDKTSRSEALMANLVKPSMPSSSTSDGDRTIRLAAPIPDVVDGHWKKDLASSAPTICRVPASELSFFPPPSKTTAPDVSLSRPPTNNHALPTHHVRHATAPSPSLATILTALPIAASTRDNIIARLSFDSLSSSFSEREREWQRGNGEGHELDDVRALQHTRSEDGRESLFGTTSWTRTNYDDSDPQHPFTSSSDSKGTRHTTRNYAEEYSGPSPYTESFSLSRVRNVQLEPSPVMQLPDLSFVAKNPNPRRGKTRPRLIDVDFGSTDSLNNFQHIDG